MADSPLKGYKPVPLYSIAPDEPLPFSVWVYFGGRMIRYRPAGEIIDGMAYNRFICKQVCEIYIRLEDLADHKVYAQKKAETLKKRLDDQKVTKEERAARRVVYDLEAVVQDLFLSREMTMLSSNLYRAAQAARASVEAVCSMPYLRIFEWVPSESVVLIDHSVRVGLLATFLAYQLGHVQRPALEQLAIAGMLHDVGKTRIPHSDDLEKADEAELERMKQHPLVSVEMIKDSPHIPPETLRIIAEHHETHNGTGFPKGIRGSKMDRLSRIFAIANAFDNLVSGMSGSRESRYGEAVHLLKMKHRRHFDPEILPKVLRLLAP